MHTNTAQYGVVAKRRLPSDFHTPVPLIPPAARINGTRRIRRATSVVVLPSVKLYKAAGKVSAALSPDKNPLAVGSLPADNAADTLPAVMYSFTDGRIATD